ncbi:MAG: hypothetical protein [Caudoviricetes sp.]|nr:MAG: hypothetical protein [Caudoviricetes sp.]
MALKVGDSRSITVSVLPAGANQEFTHQLSAAGFVSFNKASGTITALTEGRVTLTVRTIGGKHSADLVITVT